RVWRTGLPVRSAVLKPHAGRLVVGWVTTSESRLLYVFLFYQCFIYFFFFTCGGSIRNRNVEHLSMLYVLQRLLAYYDSQ
ncbi:hypothetical protein P170DRAFT_352310, partial [Aspergillus steynii IBT 23096]